MEEQIKKQPGIACFLDVETTGLSPAKEEVIELAICLFEFRWQDGEIVRIIDQYCGLREPGVPISPGAARVNGISMGDLIGKALDMDRIEAMLHSAEFIVAHNASFDRAFVNRLFPMCQHKPWLCSMSGISWKKKGFSSRALHKLLREHDIKIERAHRAEDDVMAAVNLLSLCGEDGQAYFLELLTKLPQTVNEESQAG